MSISRMSLIEIVVPRKLAQDLLVCIQNAGSLQLEEVPLVVPGIRSFLHRIPASESPEGEHRQLQEVLRAVNEMLPLFKDIDYPDEGALAEGREQLRGKSAGFLFLQTSRIRRRADSLWRKRNNIARDVKVLETYRQRLGQLQSVYANADLAGGMNTVTDLVHQKERSRLLAAEKRLNDITHGASHVLQSSRPPKKADDLDVAVFAFPAAYEAEGRDAVLSSGFPELRLPGIDTALDPDKSVEKVIDHMSELPDRLRAVEKQLKEFKQENKVALLAIEEICSDTLTRLDGLATAACSTMMNVIHAWIPEEEVAPFAERVESELGTEVVISELDQTEVHHNQIPVRLENPGSVRPFQAILKLFSDPQYGSFDPTLVMALIFPIFFGLVLGDIGYGLIIFLGALWARKKWGVSAMARDVTSIALWCAASSIVFGVIFGEFLGDLGHRTNMIPLTVGGVQLMPIWKSRELIITELLLLTIVIGFAHIILGLVLGICEAIHAKSRHHFWERIGLLCGLVGLVMWVAPIDLPFLSPGLRKGIGGSMLLSSMVPLFLTIGPVGPIEIISLVANILSYSRLMALGVAGMVVANLANSMGAEQDNLVLGVIVALPFHILAVALGILEPTIHALRLHFVEFFPKFYTGDGRAYSPLKRKRR